jgi:hypothetical protein
MSWIEEWEQQNKEKVRIQLTRGEIREYSVLLAEKYKSIKKREHSKPDKKFLAQMKHTLKKLQKHTKNKPYIKWYMYRPTEVYRPKQ